MQTRRRASQSLALALALIGAAAPARAQTPPPPEAWDVTKPRGTTRQIDFTTSEGTWMSVDISPDGQWLAFDLLGHVYRMPISGGDATVLTQQSGIAINTHPRISPDGQLIAFVSDRKGQNNLWVMNADGSNPRAVFTDVAVRAAEPVWTPDGQYIVVRRQQLGAPGGPPGSSGIWMYHKDGGSGIELVGRTQSGADWPSVSQDGRFLYFHMTGYNAPNSGQRDALAGGLQVHRMDLRTGEVTAVSSGQAEQQVRGASGGMYAPEVSPDGRWLAFARKIPDATVTWKGHTFGPRTALWLRDLESGRERLLLDPIEIDLAEGIKTLRVLPGYDWSNDGRFIVISQGGQFRRVDVATGRAEPIPFTARVQRTISQMAYAPARISDEPLEMRFARWQTASPDGKTLAFQALGRVWLMDLPNGTPRRLTGENAIPFEFSPAWSRDGRWLAYTTWSDTAGGQLWKVAVPGGTPVQLTRTAGEYVNPSWSLDGAEIVAARGAGETQHGRGMLWNTWFDLVRVPAAGGAATTVTRVSASTDGSTDVFANIRNQIVRASYGPEGRIYFQQFATVDNQQSSALVSVRADGSDRRIHLTFPFADEIVPSPDGKWVAFQESDNVYVLPFPAFSTAGAPVRIERRRGKLPVTPLTTSGGLFPTWRNDRTLEFGSGNLYFSHDIASKKTDSVTIRLSVPRAVPQGTIALTNARIITLNNRQVIERGTVLVRNGRITCVGTCESTGAHVVDAAGKTIVPGFIDVHSHNFREHRGILPEHNYETAVFLAYGVTSTMDPSMWSQNIFPAAEMIDAGLMVGARVFTTGDPLYAGDGSRQWDLTSYDEAERSIRRLASWGAITLKQYQQPRRDQRQWVAEAARKLGLNVTAENGDLEFSLGLIMDGHTGFEHPLSYAPLYGDVAKFLGQAQATYSPTFMVGGPGPWNEEYWYGELELWKDTKQQRWLPWIQLVPHTRRRMLRPQTDYSFPLLAQGLADIIAQGGYGAIGAHGQQNGIGSHFETWMAASALGPMGALEVASLHGAHFIGRDRDLGSIQTGKLADLMVLNSNPLDNIRNTTDIAWVMKGGVLYDAATLDELWPRQKPYGPYHWLNPDIWRADSRPSGGRSGERAGTAA